MNSSVEDDLPPPPPELVRLPETQPVTERPTVTITTVTRTIPAVPAYDKELPPPVSYTEKLLCFSHLSYFKYHISLKIPAYSLKIVTKKNSTVASCRF